MATQVTEQVKYAIQALKLVHGSNEEVGRILGVSKVHIGKILSDKTETIRTSTWTNMEPHLRPFLPQHAPEGTQQAPDTFTLLADWLRNSASPKVVETIINIAEMGGFKHEFIKSYGNADTCPDYCPQDEQQNDLSIEKLLSQKTSEQR